MANRTTFMGKFFLLAAVIASLVACNQKTAKEKGTVSSAQHPIRFYSKNVADSFSIFIHVPGEYNSDLKHNYPVVYVLDANLYFDILATIMHQYSEVGLVTPVILVGIGYKDFATMDSLRNRDDTYPVAIPEYEMSVSGGADRFLSFINTELIPYIDVGYRTDTSRRTLMGHSLGGYFTLYALFQNLAGKQKGFTNYIAASPSLHYNYYYLLTRLKELPVPATKNLNTYITYGGLEDSNTDSTTLKQNDVLERLQEALAGKLNYTADVYSNLDHMDTQIPTFVKGLQKFLR